MTMGICLVFTEYLTHVLQEIYNLRKYTNLILLY